MVPPLFRVLPRAFPALRGILSWIDGSRTFVFTEAMRVSRWILLLCLLFPSISASAHGLNGGYARLTVTQDEIEARFSLNLADVILHFELDGDDDHILSAEEKLSGIQKMDRFLQEQASVSVDGQRLTLQLSSAEVVRDAAGQESLEMVYSATRPTPSSTLTLSVRPDVFEKFGQTFSMLAKVEAAGNTQQAVLSIGQTEQPFSIGSAGTAGAAVPAPARTFGATFMEFLQLGIKHIFLGYDHLMFLFALILVGGRIVDLIKIVTAFTVAHSVTLALAAFNIVSLPSRPVESGIALSIAYVALENLLNEKPAHRWRLTFTFGLVHGFGFASVLKELGLPRQNLAASLLSFNLGVEIGQIAVVALLFPLVVWVSRQPYQRAVVRAASVIVLLFGLGWFIERAFGGSFMPI